MFELWQLLVVVPNMVVLLLLLFSWLKEHYVVVDLETWNKIATFYNENYSDGPQELANCVGFFREQLVEECEDEEIEENE